jgi:hypothetical protein
MQGKNIKTLPMSTPPISEKNIPPANENKSEGHFEAASVHHIKAAHFLRDRNYEKAAENAVLAQEYLNLASEARRKDTQSGF